MPTLQDDFSAKFFDEIAVFNWMARFRGP